MKKWVRILGCILFILCTSLNLTACSPTDLILPLIGLAENGSPSQVLVSQKEYIQRLSTTADSVQKSAIQGLSKSRLTPRWLLREMVFGIGINAQVGIGPFKIGAYPEIRFVFSNTTDTLVP